MIDRHVLIDAGTRAAALALPLYVALLLLLLLSTWAAGRWLLRHRPVATDDASAPDAGPLLRRLVVGLLLIIGCAALFATLAEHMRADRAIGLFDEAFSRAVVDHIPEPVLRAFFLLTFLANRETQTGIGVVVAIALVATAHPRLALGWALAVAGNGLLNTLLKGVFERARPLHPSDWLTETSFSFPSGHSSGSVVIFGMLAYLSVRLLPRRAHLPLLMLAAALALSVGASRVFLRVHFPSDVLAGFASGSAWLLVCVASIELGRWARRR